MASLAPHVSRVSKDYAPHGWSYVSEIVIRDVAAFSATAGMQIILAADSDYYIEGANVQFGAVASTSGSNHYLFELRYADNDGSLSNSKAITHSASRPNTNQTTDMWYKLPADENPLVPEGKLIYAVITEVGSGASVTDVMIQVRYRRKA